MTRIIAGTAGGRTLRTPPGSGTRPTSDRVREAVFSALEARDAVRGRRVLDLYAGSGALGLEAASRGASSVVLMGGVCASIMFAVGAGWGGIHLVGHLAQSFRRPIKHGANSRADGVWDRDLDLD